MVFFSVVFQTCSACPWSWSLIPFKLPVHVHRLDHWYPSNLLCTFMALITDTLQTCCACSWSWSLIPFKLAVHVHGLDHWYPSNLLCKFMVLITDILQTCCGCSWSWSLIPFKLAGHGHGLDHWYPSNLLCMFMVLITDTLQINPAVKHVPLWLDMLLFLNIILSYNSVKDINYIIFAIGFSYSWIEHIKRIILVYIISYILGYF